MVCRPPNNDTRYASKNCLATCDLERRRVRSFRAEFEKFRNSWNTRSTLSGLTRIMTNVKKIIGFPSTVNEVSARLVAGGVVAQALLWMVTRSPILLITLTYGFLARVLTGPKLSPLGQFVTRVVTPRLPVPEKIVAGSPKRFAQGVGLAFTAVASIAWLAGNTTLAAGVLAALIAAASLEAFFGMCLGCKMYGLMMRFGIVSEFTCEECSNIGVRHQRVSAQV